MSKVQPFKGILRTRVEATSFQGLRWTQRVRLEAHLYCIDQEWGIQTVTIEFIYVGLAHIDQEKKEERGKE